MSPKLLIADDEQKSVVPLTAILEAEGYTVDSAVDGQKALDLLTGPGGDAYAVVLADQNMPKLDGMSLLTELRQRKHQAQVIMITGAGSVDLAVEAMRHGAYDFLEKPINLAKLKALIPKALERAQLQQKNEELETKLETYTRFGEMVGQSEPMQAVYQMIERVAPSTASVLILGESGTGKELVAHALHKKSDRAKGPFFALNCAALPKEILENELFGHEKGAFTGSTNEKPGAFEMASGGTIFLDEVAEMAPDIQVKLLRALESRMVRRLGGKKEIPVDIRIVAATNKDMEKAIADGELREDLFYRLAVVDIHLPPLRERGSDRQILAQEFLKRFAKLNGKQLDGFDAAALDWVNTYSWPGNVRELRNAVEKAVIMARGPKITVDDLVSRRHRVPADASATITVTLGPNSLPEARRQIVVKALAAVGGDVDRAAREAGLTVAEVRGELLAILERRGVGSTESADVVASSADAPAAPPLPPPVVLPDDAPSPVGKLTKAPVAARGRKSS
ncbi:sigma-54-dependent Fis family transcriptional regulator [Gemmatimonadetes bacterium T265]|nr:sigma-54-dependent Fis family transcriptional regulator [Gemmatimonadetes bacterium T265]